MKIKRVLNTSKEHYGYRFHCPGCDEEHVIPTRPHPQGWDFDGNEESPTFSPSILVHSHGIILDGAGIGIRHASPALVALTVTANPLVATILGAVWLDERIGVEVIVGLLLVLVGIAVVSNLGTVLRTRRRSSASPATNP